MISARRISLIGHPVSPLGRKAARKQRDDQEGGGQSRPCYAAARIQDPADDKRADESPRVPEHRMHGERRARSGGAFLKRFRPHLALRRKLESHADAQESVEVGTRVGRELAKRE
jgi:hypothetical protein